jgi:hypothetical protein
VQAYKDRSAAYLKELDLLHTLTDWIVKQEERIDALEASIKGNGLRLYQRIPEPTEDTPDATETAIQDAQSFVSGESNTIERQTVELLLRELGKES